LGPQHQRIDLSTNNSHPPIVGTTAIPHQAHSAQCIWYSEDDTQACAKALAHCPAIRNAYIELQGNLGAGKTTLVRHLLRALGVEGRIKSPTYAVVEPHEAGDLAIWHFDFYRFNDPQEWEDAGFRDLFASQGLKLVEWPSQAAGMLPTPDLTIAIELTAQDTRKVYFSAATDAGSTLMKALPHAL
jgi:tRNA threonylcarbamoyladenosine biosynthesis protein TsaE